MPCLDDDGASTALAMIYLLGYHRHHESPELFVILNNRREHRELLGLVLATKFLAVSTLLATGPDSHLGGTNDQEEQNTPAQTTQQIDTNPGNHLEHIVRAGDQTEPESSGDTSFRGSRLAETTKHQVSVQVGNFTECKECETAVQEDSVRLV